jgi:hypothetical protein
MQVHFQLQAGVLRVEIRERETAQETRELAESVFAERAKHGALALLMYVRASRPIFKVEEYGLSRILDRIRAIPGLRVAVVTDDTALHAAHEYIELLAVQRGVSYRAFTSEAKALAWLRNT